MKPSLWMRLPPGIEEDEDLNLLVNGKPLTPLEQALVREYMVEPNGAQAARLAGYQSAIPGNAGSAAAKPRVRAAIRALQRERARRLKLEADEVVEELALLAFASFADVADWGEREDGTPWIRVKDKDAVPEAVWRAVQEMRLSNGRMSIRLHDKVYALNLLGRHLGLYKDRVEVSLGGRSPASLLADELSALSPDAREKIRLILVEDHQRAVARRRAITTEDGEG